MFPLAGKDFPQTADALASAIDEALREVFTFPKKANVVTVKGGTFPGLDSVVVNLDGAKLSAADPPPKPVGVGKRKPGPTVAKLQITGHPIQYETAKLDLDLSATGLRLDFDRDKSGRPLLVLADAEDGHVDAQIKRKDIEAVLLSAATIAGKQQGITVQELELDLTSRGERSIAADARVKARKMLISGVLRVGGAVEIDDELNATLSDLTCTGEGIIGGTAAAFARKYVEAYNGKQFPLMAFSLGDVTLRDLEIELNGSLHVSAAFGKQAKSPKSAAKGAPKATSGAKAKSKRG